MQDIWQCVEKHERNMKVSVNATVALAQVSQVGSVQGMEAALENGGWDDVALAGIADLAWEEQKRILEPVTGPLDFSQELRLKALASGAKLRQEMVIGLLPGARVHSLWTEAGSPGMGLMPRPHWPPCWNGRRSRAG